MSYSPSEDEEEILIYAELEDSVNIHKYRHIHLLGIDSKNPIIQMDGTFFTGKFQNPLGTYMFFEENALAESSDPLFDKLPEKNVKYVCKTRKYINMEHAYVTPKEGAELDLQSQLQQPEEDIKTIEFKNLQEALEKFDKEWNTSREPELDTECTIQNIIASNDLNDVIEVTSIIDT